MSLKDADGKTRQMWKMSQSSELTELQMLHELIEEQDSLIEAQRKTIKVLTDKLRDSLIYIENAE